ncbi:MAG: potassium channel family protein [Alphaproteobacteria bacterium]|nr:potassium channel family protein [Alphaproteobacteria bacterium]
MTKWFWLTVSYLTILGNAAVLLLFPEKAEGHLPVVQVMLIASVYASFFVIWEFRYGYFETGVTVLAMLGMSFCLILLFASVYAIWGINPDTGPDLHDELYFSIVTWTTLGYGDIEPTKQVRLIAAGEAMLGYIYLGLLVGLSAGLLSKQHDGADQRNHERDS